MVVLVKIGIVVGFTGKRGDYLGMWCTTTCQRWHRWYRHVEMARPGCAMVSKARTYEGRLLVPFEAIGGGSEASNFLIRGGSR